MHRVLPYDGGIRYIHFPGTTGEACLVILRLSIENSMKRSSLKEGGPDSEHGPTDPTSWVDRYGDTLFSYALTRVNNRDIAEELVQETFLGGLQSLREFRGRSAEQTWLIGILRNKVFDHFRRVCRDRPSDGLESIPAEEEQPFQTDGEWVGHWRQDRGPIEWHDPLKALEQKEFQEILRRCLENLPMRIASAFTLREMESASSEEICETLGISLDNLWVMLHRARMQLRRCLEIRWFSLHSIK